jgi:hypothetical protein
MLGLIMNKEKIIQFDGLTRMSIAVWIAIYVAIFVPILVIVFRKMREDMKDK